MTRPRPLRADTIRESCRKAQGYLGIVEADAPLIVKRGNDWCGEALSGRSYDGVNRGGVESTHPERHLGKTDQVADNLVEFQALLTKIVKDSARLRELGDALHKVIKLKTTEAGENRSESGNDCIVCTRYVAGIPSDRLRAGRCHTCYAYWTDHHREEDRPRALWEPTPEEELVTG